MEKILEVPLAIHSVPYWESYPGSLLVECWTFLGALPVTGTFVSLNKLQADGPCLTGSQSIPCLTSAREGCFICLLFWDKVKQPDRIPLIQIFMDVCVCICFKPKTLQNPVISLLPSTALNSYLYLKAFLISKFIFPIYPMSLVPWPWWEHLETPIGLNPN